MEDYPTFREYYEKELMNSDPREFMKLIPKSKLVEINSLLGEYKIPEEYHFYFYAFFQIVSLPTLTGSDVIEDELIKLSELFDIINNRSVKELTISVLGLDEKSGKHEKRVATLRTENPFLDKIAVLLKDMGKQYDLYLKTFPILAKQSRRGPKIKSTTRMLKWIIPEADQLLVEFGLEIPVNRSNFLGKLLVIAGILEPEPPHNYKTKNYYYHSRIKQYKS